jgi:predicted phage terminase large subunit-like protein
VHQRNPGHVQRIRDLLINVPPGTAKSRVVAVFATVWAWLRWPSMRIICMSVNPRVALRDGDLARELIRSEWFQDTFQPAWRIREDAEAKGRFLNTAGGARSAVGMEARIIGERGDLLLIDDPHDPEEAQSDTQRKSILERWNTSIANRVNDIRSSIRIGICQRVHEDDWSAHRLAEGWTALVLPMEFDAERRCVTPLGEDWRTEPGEILSAEQFPPDEIAKLRARTSEINWASLYQQRPAPAGGAIFRTAWWRFWRPEDHHHTGRPRGCFDGPARVVPLLAGRQRIKRGPLPAFDWVDLSIDCTFKGDNTSDNVSLQVIGGIGVDRFVWSDSTCKRDILETIEAILDHHDRFPIDRTLIEEAANGPAILTLLKGKVRGMIGVKTGRDSKEARAKSIVPDVQGGNVYLLDGAEWLDAYVHEFSVFPRGAHDDRVDALDQCLIFHAEEEDHLTRVKAASRW